MVELLSIGRGEDDFVILALALQLLHATPDGLNLHDHACFASEGVVIHLAVLAQAPVPQVVDVYLDEPFVLGTLQNRRVQRRFERVGHYCQYIYSHISF